MFKLSNPNREIKLNRHFIYLLLLFIITLGFHFPILSNSAIPLDADSLLFFYPLRTLHSDPQVGLWDPHLFSGFPRDANPQSQLLYWPNIIMHFTSPQTGYAILLLGHYLLGGWLMYLLLKGLRLSPEAAFFGALTFLLSTFWRCKITNLGLLEGISWVPGVLHYYCRSIERHNWTYAFPAGLLLGFIILAGVPHTVLFTMILLLLMGLSLWLNGGSFRHAASVMVITIGSAVLLSAGMWIPAYLYASEALRGPLELNEATAGALGWHEIWRAFAGGLSQQGISRNDPWEGTCYMGITALCFIPSGWKHTPRHYRDGLIAALIIGLLMTLGTNGYLFTLLYNLFPAFQMFNLPNRALMLAAIGLPIFAAYGFQYWVVAGWVTAKWVWTLLIAASLCLLVYLIGLVVDPWVWTTTIYSAMTQTFYPQSISDTQWAFMNMCMWGGITGLILFAKFKQYITPRLTIILFCLFVIAQSAQYNQRLFLQTTEPDYFVNPLSVRHVQKQLDKEKQQRVCGYLPLIDAGSDVRVPLIRPALMHRFSEVYGLYDIQGYDPMAPKSYAELLRAWGDHSPATDANRTVRLKTLPKTLIDLLGVKYVIGMPNYKSMYTGRQDNRGPCSLESKIDQPETTRSVLFRWLVAGEGALPLGTPVGNVHVKNGTKVIETFPIRMGVDIANYILDSDKRVQPKLPVKVFRWFPIPTQGGYTRVQQYIAQYDLNHATDVDRVAIEFFRRNVRFTVFDIALLTDNDQGLDRLEMQGELPIYENPDALPPVYLTRNLAWYDDIDELIAGMNHQPTNAEPPVFLHRKDEVLMEKSPVQSERSSNTRVNFTRPDSDHYYIHLRTKYDSVLVVTENYSSSWHATVDGVETPILQANHTFMAVPVTSGEHSIILQYTPRAFYLGCIISALTFLMIIWGITLRFKSKSQYSGERYDR